MINKKAFEIQFNWIFILVAGAAIILFFTVVVVKQKSISDTSIKTTILKSIEAIITGASVSKDTINIIDIPSSDIKVSCGRITIDGTSKTYQNLILFAPSLIKGNKLTTQTLTFSVPYRATNLLYITSQHLRYIIIGDTTLAKEINKSLPSNLKKEFYKTEPQLKDSNDYKVRFIVFGNMINFPKSLGKMPDSDVSAVRVIGNDEKGTIELYQKDKDTWLLKDTSDYIGKQSLIGAIYADTIEVYECNMQNAFSRLNLVTRVYIDRTNQLIIANAISERDIQCNQIYNNALVQLDIINDLSSNFNAHNIDILLDASNLLAIENKNAQINSCTLMY